MGNAPTSQTDPSGLDGFGIGNLNTGLDYGQQLGDLLRKLGILQENTRHMEPTRRGYVVGGTIIADQIGLRGISDACSEHDAIDGHSQGLRERIVDGTLGLAQFGLTVAGIKISATRILVQVRGPLAPGKLTASELQELQRIADDLDTEIHVVGSRAAGSGRNIGSKYPVGKGRRTKSDIDCRIDGKHPQVDEVLERVNELETPNAERIHDHSARQTRPPSIIIRPHSKPIVNY